MRSSSRKLTLRFLTLVFTIPGVLSVFRYCTSLIASQSINKKREENSVFAPPVSVPFGDEPSERLFLGGWNIVMCWPSVGGIIVNRHVSSVELDFLHLSRFVETSRSSDSHEEDAFCRRLRLTGGKWWPDYWH